ncbi:hypothetical protein DFH27DRAFT_616241 [Peziza echinospora]|nr:hypothetical protein DFH27DRAFT_616241 [Peziza echinospora]
MALPTQRNSTFTVGSPRPTQTGSGNTTLGDDDGFFSNSKNSGGMSAQTKTGIAVGITVLLLLLVTAGVGYWLYLRRQKEREFEEAADRQNNRQSSSLGGTFSQASGGGVVSPDAEKALMYQAQPPPPPPPTGAAVPAPVPVALSSQSNNYSIHPAAAGLPPTDDEAMVRALRTLDARITNHVLSFYAQRAPHDPRQPRPAVPPESLAYFRSQVDGFDRLVAMEEARAYVVRAILNAIVLGSVAQGVFFTDQREGGGLRRQPGGGVVDEYRQAREAAIMQLAANAQGNLRPLAGDATRGGEDARLAALQKVIRLVADYAGMIEARGGVYEFVWGGSATEHEPMRPPASPFQRDEMLPEKVLEIGGSREKMVRAVVFPGLQRRGEGGRKVLLAKVHVLLS